MKVLINALSARRGGGQTYLINLLDSWRNYEDAELFVAAPASLSLPEGPRIKRFFPKWPTSNPILRALWEKLFLRQLLEETGADILFCPGGIINSSVPAGCKTVTMFRNMMPFDVVRRSKYPYGLMRVRNFILERVLLRSMLSADLVIYISDFAKGLIERRSHSGIRKSVVIPHGIDRSFKTGAKQPRPKALPKGEYFLYVSILDVYKNQLEVVRGYALLKTRRQTEEKLVLAGYNSTPYAEAVRSEIDKLGLAEDVLLLGNINYRDLPAYYSNAKVNIFASECENCPNILLEALGSGRPLLTSDRLPMPEFAGDAAVYFDPSVPGDFAEKMASFVDDKAVMESLSAKAYARAQLYDWEKTAALTWKAIRGVLE